MDAVLGDQLVGQIGGRVRDDRGVGVRAHRRGSYQSRRRLYACVAAMAQDPRHRRRAASSARTSSRALAERGDELRLLARRSSKLDHLEDLEFERVDGRRHRPPRGAAGDGGRRAGLPRRRAHLAARRRPRRPSSTTNLRGARIVFEEALEAGVERVVHTSIAGAIGVAKPKGTADETTPFEIGHLGIAYVNSKHEAELEAFRLAAHGPAGGDRQPDLRARPRRPEPGPRWAWCAASCLGQIPAYVDGALNIVDVRDVADGPPARRREGRGRRALHPRRAQLHPRPPVRRPRADLRGRAAAAEAADAASRSAGAEAASRVGLPVPAAPEEIRSASLWWTYRNTKAKRELGFKPRPHEETLEDAVALAARPARRPRERAARARSGWRCGRSGARALRAGERDDRPLPLPDADQRPLPVRRGRAPPAQARARARDRAGPVPARGTARRSRSSPASAACRCSSTATR